jgi:SAM-dependent methyltransferase
MIMQSTYANNYGDLYRQHWWWRARERYVLTWIERLARSSGFGAILDIGCGDGLLFEQLRRFGDVWGIEPDSRLLSANSPWRKRIENVPFGPGYSSGRRFDLILMLDVLEHIEADRESLQRVHDLLEPGGVAIVTVPALPALWSRHDVANCHYRRYTLAALRGLIGATSFECLELHYFFGWTVLPLYVRRWLYTGVPGGDGAADYEVKPPGRLLNRLLLGTCLMEQRFSTGRGVPVGSSLFAVLRRPAAAACALSGKDG